MRGEIMVRDLAASIPKSKVVAVSTSPWGEGF
jgi:hypothetical protein